MRKSAILAAVVLLFAAGAALGAPGLWVTKPPVEPNVSWTGPPIDPHAVQGQWFLDPVTRVEEVRPLEFHDNVIGSGGGWKSYLAIEGYVKNVDWAGSNILSFDIEVTIWNDKPALTDWLDGANRHGEDSNSPQHLCDMLGTKLTASFAVGPVGPPADLNRVYNEIVPAIVATNYDELAWYCWTPDNPDPSKVPWGGYWVPTWDFGDILHDANASRIMSFTVGGAGLDPNDPRHNAIEWADEERLDLLSNRTTSLKVSDWVDNLTVDLGVPYPVDPMKGSDVSVFFVPEPGTLSLLALGGLAIFRRRK
jgi:hypothetical protein